MMGESDSKKVIWYEYHDRLEDRLLVGYRVR